MKLRRRKVKEREKNPSRNPTPARYPPRELFHSLGAADTPPYQIRASVRASATCVGLTKLAYPQFRLTTSTWAKTAQSCVRVKRRQNSPRPATIFNLSFPPRRHRSSQDGEIRFHLQYLLYRPSSMLLAPPQSTKSGSTLANFHSIELGPLRSPIDPCREERACPWLLPPNFLQEHP